MSGSNSSAPDARAATELVDPVGLTVHSMPTPQQALGRSSTRRGRLKMLLVLAACAAPVVASYFTYYVVRPSMGSASYGQLIQPSVSLPDAMAITLDGRPTPMRSLKGQWLLVLVGDAACDLDCEKRLFMQRQLREMLGRDRERVDKVWLLADDAPLRPELHAVLQATPAMTLLRLPRAQIMQWLKPESGHRMDDHLYIVDPMGEWMMRMPAQAEPTRVKRDLERLLRASASWDLPGR